MSSTIIPILGNGKVVLERNYRKTIGRFLYELPAGKRSNPKEPPIMTAKRELKEETGYTAGKIKLLFKNYSRPGSDNSVRYYYIATELVPGKQVLDHDERITVHPVSITEAVRMVKNGRIVDAKTVAGILYYYNFIKKRGG
jgi:ADP-ribose pyrophosphatase